MTEISSRMERLIRKQGGVIPGVDSNTTRDILAKYDENKASAEDAEKERRDNIEKDLDIVLKRVDQNVDEQQKTINREGKKEANRRLEVEGIEVDKFLIEGLVFDGPHKKDSLKTLGQRKAQLRGILEKRKKGEPLSDEDKDILDVIGLGSGVRLEENRVENTVEQATPPQDLQRVLDLPKTPMRVKLLEAYLLNNPSMRDDVFALITDEMQNNGPRVQENSFEIPTQAVEFRKLVRSRVREILARTENDSELTLTNIRNVLSGELSAAKGFDISKGPVGFQLFAHDLENRQETMGLVEREIEARVNLRRLQLFEETLLGADKKFALNKYCDMKGSETREANPLFVAIETYKWLKNIEDLNDPDGATTAKVDHAFSLLLKLGLGDNNNFLGNDSKYVAYGNIYAPKREETKRLAIEEIKRDCGIDATDLALQLFMALKEEGNFNKDHYLYVLFKTSEARKNAKSNGNPIGSNRVYVENEPGHDTEIPYLAKSSLNVAKYTVDMSGTTLMSPGIHLERTLRGTFLRDLDCTTAATLPDRETQSQSKKANKIKTAIEAIGALGSTPEKTSVVGAAMKALSEIRITGQELVDAKAISKDQLDDQMYCEAQNVIWELSVDNPKNSVNFQSQQRQKPNFLVPSQLATLLVQFGQYTNQDYRFVDDVNGHFSRLRLKISELIDKTYFFLSNEDPNKDGLRKKEGDDNFMKEQALYLRNKTLPYYPGDVVKDVKTGPLMAAEKVLNVFDGPIARMGGETPSKNKFIRAVQDFFKKPNI